MHVCMYVCLTHWGNVCFFDSSVKDEISPAKKKKKMPDGYYPVINDEAENGQDLTGYSNEATLLCV